MSAEAMPSSIVCQGQAQWPQKHQMSPRQIVLAYANSLNIKIRRLYS